MISPAQRPLSQPVYFSRQTLPQFKGEPPQADTTSPKRPTTYTGLKFVLVFLAGLAVGKINWPNTSVQTHRTGPSKNAIALKPMSPPASNRITIHMVQGSGPVIIGTNVERQIVIPDPEPPSHPAPSAPAPTNEEPPTIIGI